mmetsp:Transcript_27266/g.63482  ORF Transcript_27266/g.63482 Transcript_27266/m.63482 type:complete len:136 (-) Transcript_27266:335-742(-)
MQQSLLASGWSRCVLPKQVDGYRKSEPASMLADPLTLRTSEEAHMNMPQRQLLHQSLTSQIVLLVKLAKFVDPLQGAVVSLLTCRQVGETQGLSRSMANVESLHSGDSRMGCRPVAAVAGHGQLSEICPLPPLRP